MHIKLESLKHDLGIVELEPTCLVYHLRQEACQRCSIGSKGVILIFNGFFLEDELTIKDCGIYDGCTVLVVLSQRLITPILLNIRFSPELVITSQLKPDSEIRELRDKVINNLKETIESGVLTYKGQILQENRKLGDYRIESNSNLLFELKEISSEIQSLSVDKALSMADGVCKSDDDITENLYEAPDCAESKFNHDSVLRIQGSTLTSPGTESLTLVSSTSTPFIDVHSISRISKHRRPSIFNQNGELKLNQYSEKVVDHIVTNEAELFKNRAPRLPIFHCDSVSSDFENELSDLDRFIAERIDSLRLNDTPSEMIITPRPQNAFEKVVLNFQLENGETIPISMNPSADLDKAVPELSRQTGIAVQKLKLQSYGDTISYKTKFRECVEIYEGKIELIFLP
ncbi:unnamed protein product [Rodentolepis nana]|uniref:Ubiquitin-like domain-containing protein n=1 Tax=Rodentolepis nana TaxID=102285 RepID=A0A0R3T4A3_RODNA|nr:unnamed protein product [Rodentolepis nana]